MQTEDIPPINKKLEGIVEKFFQDKFEETIPKLILINQNTEIEKKIKVFQYLNDISRTLLSKIYEDDDDNYEIDTKNLLFNVEKEMYINNSFNRKYILLNFSPNFKQIKESLNPPTDILLNQHIVNICDETNTNIKEFFNLFLIPFCIPNGKIIEPSVLEFFINIFLIKIHLLKPKFIVLIGNKCLSSVESIQEIICKLNLKKINNQLLIFKKFQCVDLIKENNKRINLLGNSINLIYLIHPFVIQKISESDPDFKETGNINKKRLWDLGFHSIKSNILESTGFKIKSFFELSKKRKRDNENRIVSSFEEETKKRKEQETKHLIQKNEKNQRQKKKVHEKKKEKKKRVQRNQKQLSKFFIITKKE